VSPPAPVRPVSTGPWYFSTVAIVIALLTVGPLALPLIWWHPRCSPVQKMLLTVLVLVVTVVLCWLMWLLYVHVREQLAAVWECL